MALIVKGGVAMQNAQICPAEGSHLVTRTNPREQAPWALGFLQARQTPRILRTPREFAPWEPSGRNRLV
jgi:hypothetical protein